MMRRISVMKMPYFDYGSAKWSRIFNTMMTPRLPIKHARAHFSPGAARELAPLSRTFISRVLEKMAREEAVSLID